MRALKKTVSIIFFFSSESKSIKEKESLQDESSDKKLSCQMLLLISCKVTGKFRHFNIGGSFPFTNKSNLIVVICKNKVKLLRGKKFRNGCWCWSHFLSHYPVKFGVQRTCGIGDKTFFICHKTTYNHGSKNHATLYIVA